MIVQRREFANYLREDSGVKDHSASQLLLTKEEELGRAQREKQISQAATRRFSAKPKAILH